MLPPANEPQSDSPAPSPPIAEANHERRLLSRKFFQREDAELARHQVEGAGIACTLCGEHSSDILGDVATGGYRLEVGAGDYDRAEAVLAEHAVPEVSEAELEELAMSSPGNEHEVEPREDLPEEPPKSFEQRIKLGLCIGVFLGVFNCLLHGYFSSLAHAQEMLGSIIFAIGSRALLGMIVAILLGGKRTE